MIDVNFSVAFIAGVISFFAPCVIPIIPSYVSYITGVSFNELNLKNYRNYFVKIFLSSLFYILGFSLIFVILGTTSAGIGILLKKYEFILQRIGGVIFIIMGAEFAGFINLPILARQFSFSLTSWASRFGYLRAFVMGVIFATAWSPCIGAVLGSVLALAAVSGTAFNGAFLLFAYSLGISLPFVIFSLTLMWAPVYMKSITKNIIFLSRISGIFLIVIGALLLTDNYKHLNGFLFEIAYKIGYKVR